MTTPTLRFTWEGQERVVPLNERTSIGREVDNDIYIPSTSISRHHAVVVREAGGFFLSDLGSANGIEHDNKKVTALRLEGEMTFALGDVEFRFVDAAEKKSGGIGVSPVDHSC